VLKDIGVELITEVSSGQEALIVLDSKRVDLVFCDWEISDLSGVELLQTVRQIDSFLPYFLVSSHTSREEVKTAIDAGVTDFIVKPYAPSTIQVKIEALIGRRHKRKTLSPIALEEAEARHKQRLVNEVGSV
jgi:two-component system chemotaxis response regulator CheY